MLEHYESTWIQNPHTALGPTVPTVLEQNWSHAPPTLGKRCLEMWLWRVAASCWDLMRLLVGITNSNEVNLSFMVFPSVTHHTWSKSPQDYTEDLMVEDDQDYNSCNIWMRSHWKMLGLNSGIKQNMNHGKIRTTKHPWGLLPAVSRFLSLTWISATSHNPKTKYEHQIRNDSNPPYRN